MDNRLPGFYWVDRFVEEEPAIFPGEKTIPAHFSGPIIGQWKTYVKKDDYCWWFCGEPWRWDEKSIVKVLSERLEFKCDE